MTDDSLPSVAHNGIQTIRFDAEILSLNEQPGDQTDLVIHSFVIRIWLDDASEGAGAPVWRGQLTHIPGGERMYFNDLAEIPNFIGRHLITASDSRNSPKAVP